MDFSLKYTINITITIFLYYLIISYYVMIEIIIRTFRVKFTKDLEIHHVMLLWPFGVHLVYIDLLFGNTSVGSVKIR